MCTAIRFNNRYFGRTFDFERSFGESLLVVPRGKMPILESKNQYAIMAIGVIFDDTPLCFDGVNEWGLVGAALNFPEYAHYQSPPVNGTGIPSGHLLSHVLGLCRSVGEARQMLEKITITNEWVGGNRPTPLHWTFADGRESMVVEQTFGGLRIYDDFIGVLANSPDYSYQRTTLSCYSCLSSRNPSSAFGGGKLHSRGMGAIGLPGDFSSSSRFVRAAYLKKWAFDHLSGGATDLKTAFSVLSSLAIPRGAVITDEGLPVLTLYTMVVDMEKPGYYLTTSTCSAVSHIDLTASLCDGREITSYPIYRDENILPILNNMS